MVARLGRRGVEGLIMESEKAKLFRLLQSIES